MRDLDTIINNFIELGKELSLIAKQKQDSKYYPLIEVASQQNGWFSIDSILNAIESIGASLSKNNFDKWLNSYTFPTKNTCKTIGLVLAGNIPLVGFHDILCTLITGNKVRAKLSSKDKNLYQLLLNLLQEINPKLACNLEFTEEKLTSIDAIIATGSNNSARYFEYYFNKYPHIIRQNRNSIGIISGNETTEDFIQLGKDIFTYFGLGCRNVSYLLFPEKYDVTKIYSALDSYNSILRHTKYMNNYDYQKAILSLNLINHFDNGSLILKQDENIASPIGVIHYGFYKNEHELENYINMNKHKIQCIVSNTKWKFSTYSFGEAQNPQLWDYADNIDTIEFLLNLNKK